MAHAVVRGSPTKAQMYLENIIQELVAETGRSEDRHSLNRILFKCLRDNPDRLCLIDGKTDERLTNGQLLRRAVQAARALSAHGLKAGDVAVVMAQTHIDFATLYYGALFAGVTLFNLEPILTSYEVRHYVNLTKTAIVFCDADRADLMREALKEVPWKPNYVVFGDICTKGEMTFSKFVKGYCCDLKDYWPLARDKDDVPLLFTTSGSTGLGPPKVVPIPNGGLVAQAPEEWVYEEQFPRTMDLMLMMFHSQWTVHTKLFITAVVYGATILVQSQSPNSSNMLDLIKKYKPTWIVITPPDTSDIIQSSEYQHGDLHSVKTWVMIGVAPTPTFFKDVKKELNPDAKLCNRYGMTEAQGYISMGDEKEPPTLGPITNIFYYKLVDQDGQIVEINKPGELYLKCEYLPKTYYGDDEAARNMYTPDGWFKTGDLLREDEHGIVYYVERIKFMIYNKGYPFSPLEVEEVVCGVPNVAAAVVVGLDDTGPAALVVPKKGVQPSRDAIKDAVKAKLNYYKHLSCVGFIDALPRTSRGKIHRRKCADIIQGMIANKQCY